MLRRQNADLGTDFIKVKTNAPQDVHFANVDLEIKSRENLHNLVNEFGADVCVLFHDRLEDGYDFASLEIRLDKVASGIHGEADETIKAFCLLIENLSSESRNIWDNCEERKFDVGFESGNTEKTFSTEIENKTINRVAQVGANIVITIYPVLDYKIERKENL